MKNGRKLSLAGALQEIGCELIALSHEPEKVSAIELWRLGRQLAESGAALEQKLAVR